MYTLPAGYTTTVVHQTTYYVVDGEYMKKAYEGDKVVYVVVDDPKETSTDKADAQAQPAQAEPAQAQPAQTQPASTGTAEQKLLDLKSLYNKGLIDKEEYDTKKKEILDSMWGLSTGWSLSSMPVIRVQIFLSPKTIEFLRQDNRINKIIFFLLINKLKSCKNI